MKSLRIRNIVNKPQRTGLRTEDNFFPPEIFPTQPSPLSIAILQDVNVIKKCNRHELRVDHRTKVILSIVPEKNISTTSCVTLNDTTPADNACSADCNTLGCNPQHPNIERCSPLAVKAVMAGKLLPVGRL
jgi:hypothetical protein